MKKITGGQAVVEALELLKISTIFGMPGQHNLAIYKALVGSCLKHVSIRHEQGAGFMADGFARTSGKIAVAMVISGPGLTNILTAMGEAYHEAIPMLVISTNNPTRYLESHTGMLHELSQSNTMVRSVAKESRRVSNIEAIILQIIEAYHLTQEGRPGPVHVEIPLDLLENEFVRPNLKKIMEMITAQRKPKISKGLPGFKAAVQKLKTARKPFIIVGGGAWQAGENITRLAEILAAPILLTHAAKGTINDDHPLCLSARHHFPAVQNYLNEADVVLAFGTELGEDVYCNPISIKGYVIQIDLDEAAFEKNQKADICLTADASQTAMLLNEQIQIRSDQSKSTHQKIRDIKKKAVQELPLIFQYKDLNKILNLLKEVRQALPQDAILVTDSTKPAYVGFSEFPSYIPRSFLFPCGYGTLGMALPAAVGAKLSNPKRAVCVLAGDGGFQFTMAELGTACQEKLNIPIIIYNNHGLGEIKEYEQESNFESFIGVFFKNPEFESLAAAYKIPYYRVQKKGDLQKALTDSLKLSGPSLIEINVK